MNKENISIRAVSVPRSSNTEIEIVFLANDGEELRLNIPLSELNNLIEPLLDAAAASSLISDFEPTTEILTDLPPLLHARNIGLTVQQMEDGKNVVLYSVTEKGERLLLAFSPSLFRKLASYTAEIQGTHFSDDVH